MEVHRLSPFLFVGDDMKQNENVKPGKIGKIL